MQFDKIFNIIYQELLFQERIFPIKSQILNKALDKITFFNDDGIIEQSDHQKYIVQLPQQLYQLTQNSFNSLINPNKLIEIIPQFSKVDSLRIFPCLIDLNDEQEKQNFIKAITDKFDPKSIQKFKWSLKTKPRGCVIDLTPYFNVYFLLFNKSNYNRRTIYHQWTHVLQKIFGQKYQIVISNRLKETKVKNKKLLKFGLSFQLLSNYYFSDKEYVTHLDNLIYMLKEVWKNKFSNINKLIFLQKFIQEFSSDNPKVLLSKFFQSCIQVNPDFRNDILFFVGMYICFSKIGFSQMTEMLRTKFY